MQQIDRILFLHLSFGIRFIWIEPNTNLFHIQNFVSFSYIKRDMLRGFWQTFVKCHRSLGKYLSRKESSLAFSFQNKIGISLNYVLCKNFAIYTYYIHIGTEDEVIIFLNLQLFAHPTPLQTEEQWVLRMTYSSPPFEMVSLVMIVSHWNGYILSVGVIHLIYIY